MRISSDMQTGGAVIFPAFQAERIYMREFRQGDGYKAVPERWRDTVAMMLAGVETDLPGYLMVDQKRLVPGEIHRRGGVHVDGNWMASAGSHRNPTPPGHNHPPDEPSGPRHFHGFEYAPEAIVLASNVEGCRVFLGEFDGCPTSGGDCSHFDLSGAQQILMQRNRVYRCTATTIHESVPHWAHAERTVVRINIPGYVAKATP